MTNKPLLRILILEDDPKDAELVRELLEANHFVCDFTLVRNRVEFLTALEDDRIDVVLADYKLPSFDGLSALMLTVSARPDLPFIFVSGSLGEEIAIETLKIGATDYVLKTGLSRLVPAVRRALQDREEKAERKKVEEALRRSERELRQVVETIPAMVWSALSDASNVSMNRRWTEYTGTSAAGLGWQVAVHPDDLKRHMEVFRACSDSGLPFEDEVRLRGADSEYRWFFVQGMPLRDERGKILKWYGIVTDIEDRKRAVEDAKRAQQALERSEAELRRSEKELREVIDTIPTIAWSALADGSNNYVNKRFVEYSGLSAEQAAESSWQAAIHPDDLQQHLRKWIASVATGKPHESEVRFRRVDGQYRWHLCRGVPLRDEAGNIVKWYGVLTDVEERKQAEFYLSKASRLTAVAELSASIAHELNQPLMSVLANAEAGKRWLAVNPPNLVETKASIERTIRDARAADEVMLHIRGLFKRESFEKTQVTIRDVLSEAVRFLRGDPRKHDVPIDWQLDEHLPTVSVDLTQIQQVFINLLSNAMEALEGSQISPHIIVRASATDQNQMLIQVIDNGPGVADQERIFDAFVTTKKNGMGIGLAVSRSIVEAHCGRLWAENNPSGGATFSVALPLPSGQSNSSSSYSG